jgi:hypothetical protein
MKQLLLVLCLTLVMQLHAQKNSIRVYGFSQGISAGIRPATINEKGETGIKKKATGKKYLIYLEYPAGQRLTPTELWINGEKFKFHATAVTSPVLLNTGLSMPGQKEKVLIPQTENQLWQLVPLMEMNITEKDKRNIVQQKPLVIFYSVNGKSCHLTLDSLQELPELVME